MLQLWQHFSAEFIELCVFHITYFSNGTALLLISITTKNLPLSTRILWDLAGVTASRLRDFTTKKVNIWISLVTFEFDHWQTLGKAPSPTALLYLRDLYLRLPEAISERNQLLRVPRY